jgi:hypothetical protein
MMEARRQVLPEDVQAILASVVGHRLHGNAEAVKGWLRRGEGTHRQRPDPLIALIANLRQSIADRIFRAIAPESPPVTLVQRRIFILPSKQGYVFAFVLLLLLVGSINYNLSLGYSSRSC